MRCQDRSWLSEEPDKQEKAAIRLLKIGSGALGGLAGSAVGLFFGGPEGAIAGGASGAALKEVLSTVGEIGLRQLSRREEIRIGTAAISAGNTIALRLEAGEELRSDGFFEYEDEGSRSSGHEIFEGVLLKCKNAHEEKKIPYIANIFSNTAFSSDISSDEANYLLRLAESITFRQMCFLSIFERKTEIGIELPDRDLDAESKAMLQDLGALQEILLLVRDGLVHLPFENKTSESMAGAIVVADSELLISNLEEVIPNRMKLTELGRRCYEILGLGNIPVDDMAGALKTLSTHADVVTTRVVGRPFVLDFGPVDWNRVGEDYEIRIPAGQHHKGKGLSLEVSQLEAGTYQSVVVDTLVEGNLSVVIRSRMPFQGRLQIR